MVPPAMSSSRKSGAALPISRPAPPAGTPPPLNGPGPARSCAFAGSVGSTPAPSAPSRATATSRWARKRAFDRVSPAVTAVRSSTAANPVIHPGGVASGSSHPPIATNAAAAKITAFLIRVPPPIRPAPKLPKQWHSGRSPRTIAVATSAVNPRIAKAAATAAYRADRVGISPNPTATSNPASAGIPTPASDRGTRMPRAAARAPGRSASFADPATGRSRPARCGTPAAARSRVPPRLRRPDGRAVPYGQPESAPVG